MLHCKEGRTWDKYVINEGFMFRANRLCILVGSVHLFLLQEAHGGGLMGHFGAKKTEAVLSAHFFIQRCDETLRDLYLTALHVKRLSHD